MIVDALMPRATTLAPDDDYWFGPGPLDSDVTPDTAIEVAAVFACVRVLAETMAHLPLHLMAIDGHARRQAREHPLYNVLHYEPNSWQTSFEFREMMQGHLCLRGNAYAQIRPGKQGAVDQLIPLHPDRMEVYRLDVGKLGYLYRDKYGQPYRLAQDEVFHLRFLSFNGYTGISPITVSRYPVEMAQRIDQHGIKFYRNAGRPSGVVGLPEGVWLGDEEQHKRMKKSWREAHTGDDLFTVAILEGGAEWKAMGLSNEDAQYLDSRRFGVNEIARIFRVPPDMIGSAIEHGLLYANMEHRDLAFLKHTMLSWVCRWEQAMRRDLIVDRARYYPKFSLEGLLRADSQTRAKVHRQYLGMGWSPNEIRELEDKPPIPGGDRRYIDKNLVPLDDAGEAPPGGPKKLPAGDDVSALPPVSSSFLRQWVADAADRIASHEIGVLEQHAEKAEKDRAGFDAGARRHWETRAREYVARTLAPILAARESKVDAVALAAEICDRAIGELTSQEPAKLLATWRKERAEELANLLYEELRDGTEPKP